MSPILIVRKLTYKYKRQRNTVFGVHELSLRNSLRKQLRNQSDDLRQLLLRSRRRSVTPGAKSPCGLRRARVARPGCSDHADLVSKTNGRTRARKTFRAPSNRTDGAGTRGAVLRFCVCKVGQTMTGIPSLSFLLSWRTSSLSLEERRHRCGIGEVRGSPFHLFLCLYFLRLFWGRSSFSKTEGKTQGVHLPPTTSLPTNVLHQNGTTIRIKKLKPSFTFTSLLM